MLGPAPHWFGSASVVLISLAAVAFYAAVVVAILKVFEISRDVKEIKRAVTAGPVPVPPP